MISNFQLVFPFHFLQLIHFFFSYNKVSIQKVKESSYTPIKEGFSGWSIRVSLCATVWYRFELLKKIITVYCHYIPVRWSYKFTCSIHSSLSTAKQDVKLLNNTHIVYATVDRSMNSGRETLSVVNLHNFHNYVVFIGGHKKVSNPDAFT